MTRKQEVTSEFMSVEEELEPLNGCWEVRYKVDEYEWTAPTVVTKVSPDSITWGTVAYGYFINRQIEFRVSVFIESQWTSAGFFIVNKNSAGSHGADFLPGQEYYVWMNFKYRYEKWRVYGRCDLTRFDYYEEYVYTADFYPETISGGPTPPDAQLPSVDSWVYEGKYNATSPYIAYYYFSYSNFGSTSFAIDALKFISVLSLIGKISSSAATAATIIGLIISVNFVYNNQYSFYFHIWLRSNPGTVHSVYRALTLDDQSVPVLYIVSYCVRI
ncbi:MAG: hypothetical protein QXE66_06775 [Desulfurococcaceae archaeon]